MKRNSLLVGIAAVVAIVGGVVFAQRLRNRNLPSGEMTQILPTPEAGTAASPIAGKSRVKIVTDRGEVTIELDLATQAELLGKLSRGECDGLTLQLCGVSISSLSPQAKIVSSLVLSK